MTRACGNPPSRSARASSSTEGRSRSLNGRKSKWLKGAACGAAFRVAGFARGPSETTGRHEVESAAPLLSVRLDGLRGHLGAAQVVALAHDSHRLVRVVCEEEQLLILGRDHPLPE